MREYLMRSLVLILMLILSFALSLFLSAYLLKKQTTHTDMVWIPGGEFLMGSNSQLAHRNEKPAHTVAVHGFWMDKTDVTNAQFAAFVKSTGYVTTAEQKPDWNTLKVQLLPGIPKPPDNKLVPGAMVFMGTENTVPLED